MGTFLTDSWENIGKFFTGGNAPTTANPMFDTTGMTMGTPTSNAAATGAAQIKNIGLLTSVMGGINSAIGSYYAAQSAQYQAKSQASSLNFQSDMAALNASQAENNAQSILEQGKNQVSQYTMQAGQQRSSAVTKMAASGVALGEGSSKEVLASMDMTKDLNVLAINSSATRSAWGERTAATNDSNQSLLARTSAQNATSTANSISPGLAVTGSLLNSATSIAGQWDYRRKLQLATSGGIN